MLWCLSRRQDGLLRAAVSPGSACRGVFPGHLPKAEAAKQESRKAGKQEGRKAGKQESRKAGRQDCARLIGLGVPEVMIALVRHTHLPPSPEAPEAPEAPGGL